MYKEEIVKKCLVDNHKPLLEYKGFDIDDLIILKRYFIKKF